ncbi:hypothetical protein EQ718_14760 (plasmid) [Paracoccus versutus]|nr:hypothetical protein EQ718_14760 [Paracoccus versutus]
MIPDLPNLSPDCLRAPAIPAIPPNEAQGRCAQDRGHSSAKAARQAAWSFVPSRPAHPAASAGRHRDGALPCCPPAILGPCRPSVRHPWERTVDRPCSDPDHPS